MNSARFIVCRLLSLTLVALIPSTSSVSCGVGVGSAVINNGPTLATVMNLLLAPK